LNLVFEVKINRKIKIIFLHLHSFKKKIAFGYEQTIQNLYFTKPLANR
jgi:hypothetical protein